MPLSGGDNVCPLHSSLCPAFRCRIVRERVRGCCSAGAPARQTATVGLMLTLPPTHLRIRFVRQSSSRDCPHFRVLTSVHAVC